MPDKSDIAKILLPSLPGEVYDYRLPEAMVALPGSFVRVPFGRKEAVGVVWELSESSELPFEKIREVKEIIALPALGDAMRSFIDKVAEYNLSPRGPVLKMAMSIPDAFDEGKKSRIKPREELKPCRSALNDEQEAAAGKIKNALVERKHKAFLLDGVTGSGKTEVYFEVIAEVMRGGGQALVMLPEIGLSHQWLERFSVKFAGEPAVWHSEVSAAKKRETWKGVLSGVVKVVVGARSSLFLPFSDLRLIVVDEEHDQSYKQEEGVIYQARDMAVLRGMVSSAPVVLASATPSLETTVNANSGKYDRLALTSRYHDVELPEVKLVDLREFQPERGKFISPLLIGEIRKTLEAGKQAMLFLNRRGYAPLTLCRTCGHRFACKNCATWLVLHKGGRLMCHHCGHMERMPNKCPECEAEESFASCGPGVERIEEEARETFPDARIAVVASDMDDDAGKMRDVLDEMQRGEIDILIGTQMVAKGHHFPKLQLVGVVDADLGLAGGDLRASERTYQLLHQVAGRSGRESGKGLALLQTYLPEHPVMQALAGGGRDRFFEVERYYREQASMPPFGRLAAVILSGANSDEVRKAADDMARCAPFADGIRVLGPAPAAINFLRGKYRWRFLLKAGKKINSQKVMRGWLVQVKIPANVKVKVDIDPYSFV